MEKDTDSFIQKYLEYTDKTECPVVYSRWAALTGIGALLGRSCFLKHGHFKVYPTLYCVLVGTAGARKDTSINIFKKLMIEIGYDKFSPNKIKPETFLKFLSESIEHADAIGNILNTDIFQGVNTEANAEIFVAAGELNNFIGAGNLDFMSILGELWDFEGIYKNPLITRKSVAINNPTVSILAGNTPTGMHIAFPAETIGQGFFSRLILIHGEPRDRKYSFPETPSDESTRELLTLLQHLQKSCIGELTIDGAGRSLLDKIYKNSPRVEDHRFDSYNTRRFTHLLKLCILTYAAGSRRDGIISSGNIIEANTVLAQAEKYMAKSLGGFGKARNSDVSHKIVSLLESSSRVLTLMDLWKHVSADLDKLSSLAEIIQSLLQADKIMNANGAGFLIKRKLIAEKSDEYIDLDYLTKEEREMPI